jgi:hypothetical protein
LKKIKKLTSALVALTICAVFLWLPIFVSYYGLMEADFLTTNLSYENTDLDLFPAGQKFQSLSWGSNTGFNQWLGHSLEGPYAFHLLIPLPGQNNPMLRC